MENKYYTPEIEEFHVGFEYEQYSGYEWVKRLFKDLSGIYNLENAINQEMIRVKYLDREDIISLEWRPHGFNDAIYYKGNHMIFYEEEKRQITIAIVDPSKDEDMMVSLRSNEVYQITIKNKSELKKLSKQLRI